MKGNATIYMLFLSFPRLKSSLERSGCEIKMDDTKGRITVKSSQEKIQQLKNEIQIIVGGFGEHSLTESKFSLLKTDKGLSHAKSLLSTENSTVEILVNDQGSVMMYDLDETKVQQAYKTLENAICDYKLPQSKSSISLISVLIFSWTDKTMYWFVYLQKT